MDYTPRPDEACFLLDAVLGATPRLRALPPFRGTGRSAAGASARRSRQVRRRGHRALQSRGRRGRLPLRRRQRHHAARLPGGVPSLRRGRLAGPFRRARGRRPGPALGARGDPFRMAQRGQPWPHHGARPAARRLRVPQAPRQRRTQAALPFARSPPASGWPPCASPKPMPAATWGKCARAPSRKPTAASASRARRSSSRAANTT